MYLGLCIFLELIPTFVVELQRSAFLGGVLANCWTSSLNPWGTRFFFRLIGRGVRDGWSRLSCSTRSHHHNLTLLDLQPSTYRQARLALPGVLVPIVLGNMAFTATSTVRTLGHHYLLATYHRQATFIAFRCCARASRVVKPFRLAIT